MNWQFQWTCLEWRSDMWYVGGQGGLGVWGILGSHIFLQSIHIRGELLVKFQCTCMFSNHIRLSSSQTSYLTPDSERVVFYLQSGCMMVAALRAAGTFWYGSQVQQFCVSFTSLLLFPIKPHLSLLGLKNTFVNETK